MSAEVVSLVEHLRKRQEEELRRLMTVDGVPLEDLLYLVAVVAVHRPQDLPIYINEAAKLNGNVLVSGPTATLLGDKAIKDQIQKALRELGVKQ